MKFAATFLLFVGFSAVQAAFFAPHDPDDKLDAPQLIKSRGFDVETHIVPTDDGYLLTVHRIVNPKIVNKGRPIILQHGLFCSSRDWIVNSPDGYIDDPIPGNNLGFELAKKGYDIWMTNSRGNTYSQGHKNLSNKNPDFWDFSFSDMIKKDVPACIDYVLQQTGEKDLAYIGHSQGASIMFGLLGSPAGEKYNALVKPFIALAPVTSFKFMSRPYRLLGKIPFLDKILGLTKSEFMPSSYLTKMLSSQMCPLPIKQLCMNPLLAVNGFDKDHINMTRMGVYSTGFPAGTSTKNLKHYLQLLKTGVFKDFDYGHDENRLHYEQLTPPVFEVSRIGGYESPQIAIINSFDDFMATPGDVNLLRKEIGVTPICDRVLYARNWNHMDFLYGMQQHDYVNSLVYKILENKKC